MRPTSLPFKILGRLKSNLEEHRYRKLSSAYDISGYKRIYLIHIRKTGGTSLNSMFFSLGDVDAQSFYRELLRTPSRRIVRNGKVFVRSNLGLINKGNYFYASSHAPLHELRLPENTFTVTCFRDPLSRLVSNYNMFMDHFVNGKPHPGMAGKDKWLSGSFDDYIDRIPRDFLLNQIHMFSKDFDVAEAVARAKRVSHYFFTEDFDKGIEGLNRKTGLNLQAMHVRKAEYRAEIPESSIARVRERLAKEYSFLDALKSKNYA